MADVPTLKVAPEFVVIQLAAGHLDYDQKILKLQPAVRLYPQGKGKPSMTYILEGTVERRGDS